MKTTIITLVLLLTLALPLVAQPTTTSFTNTSSLLIPDGNLVGAAEQFTVAGLGGSVTNVTLALNITGGFNGDLYAYLVNPTGQLAILLNRPGVDGGNVFGYSDAGFNITLAASGNDVHYYDNYTPTITGGQLTGTWAADGRNIDPQSVASAFGTAPRTAGLDIYNGLNGSDANGAWTLFLADVVSGGGSPTLNSAILSIMTVPEPQTWLMLGGGLALFSLLRSRRKY